MHHHHHLMALWSIQDLSLLHYSSNLSSAAVLHSTTPRSRRLSSTSCSQHSLGLLTTFFHSGFPSFLFSEVPHFSVCIPDILSSPSLWRLLFLVPRIGSSALHLSSSARGSLLKSDHRFFKGFSFYGFVSVQ